MVGNDISSTYSALEQRVTGHGRGVRGSVDLLVIAVHSCATCAGHLTPRLPCVICFPFADLVVHDTL